MGMQKVGWESHAALNTIPVLAHDARIGVANEFTKFGCNRSKQFSEHSVAILWAIEDKSRFLRVSRHVVPVVTLTTGCVRVVARVAIASTVPL